MTALYDDMMNSLYQGDADTVATLTQKALDGGETPHDVLTSGLVAGMNVVGKDFRDGTLFVPEVLAAARAMKAGMAILRPLLTERDTTSAGRIVVGTVKGDLHDIGKNLVAMMMEGAGFEVFDLGVNASPDDFVRAAKEHEAHLVGMSALLTTTMTEMKAVIKAFEAEGLRDKVKIIIGGAPVTENYAQEIGADGYAANASMAVDLARDLLGVTA